MSNPYFEYRDVERDAVRAACERLERAVSRSPAVDDEVRSASHALVALLALGEPRALRECPACHGMVMREATRCHHCWSDLDKLAPAATTPATES